MTPPQRDWRSYGDELEPTGREALDGPFSDLLVVDYAIHLRLCGKDPCLRRHTWHTVTC